MIAPAQDLPQPEIERSLSMNQFSLCKLWDANLGRADSVIMWTDPNFVLLRYYIMSFFIGLMAVLIFFCLLQAVCSPQQKKPGRRNQDTGSGGSEGFLFWGNSGSSSGNDCSDGSVGGGGD